MDYKDEPSFEEELSPEFSGSSKADNSAAKEKPVRKGSRVIKIISNKYLLTILFFIVWLLFFDSNNLISRYKVKFELRQMHNQKQYYTDEIETNEKIKEQLTNDLDAIETFGREKYLMKRDNEDIYLIIEE